MPEQTFAGTEDERKERSSAAILAALNKAKADFREWQTTCDLIDQIYSRDGEFHQALINLYGGESTWKDNELDLFWSSTEVLKTAVYARPPKPAVKPMFSDGDLLKNKTAEILERASTSVFVRTGIDEVMCEVRDDLIFAGRGVIWLRYETEDGQKVCVEHLDRKDFLHETARKWSEVGWVAGGFWLTFDQMVERFSKRGRKLSEDVLRGAKYSTQRDKDDQTKAAAEKCQVWEVWHRADNKVYWVTEGVDVLLDESEPELKLSGFFPCPKPAFGTLRRRSLIPVPDWQRYAIHFRKIGDLTGRIYTLLDCVRMKGLIPGGGDIGTAIEQAMRSEDDQIVIQVPGAALQANDMSKAVVWLPLDQVAAAITGLIEARAQLINDFYELSGISDIMRGATEAEETLGAQRLKSQYGSVRVRGKIDALQRIAAEAVKIAAEIVAEKFSQQTILDMAQMAVPTKAELKKRVDEIEGHATKELEALSEQAEQMAGQMEQVDPAQAQAQLQQAQQGIFEKYAPLLAEVQKEVPVEDVMKLLRDDRARSFAFEVETDSTILTDEIAEKQSRNEFMEQLTGSVAGLAQVAAMGEQAIKLWGEGVKFTLAPYRAGRSMDGAIDAFVEAAPQIAQQMANGQDDGMAEATNKLAEAEAEKARAQMAKVEADAALKAAENERKMAELQIKAENDRSKLMAEAEKLRQQAEANMVKAEEALAKVDLLRAQTMKALAEAGVAISSQQLDEFKSLKDIEMREADQAMAAANAATDREFRERGESRADRQQQLAERTPE
jgi:hypothetical protein